MKKLMAILVLAGVLSVPSVVFADEMEAEEKELTVEDRVMMLEEAAATGASWYGSLVSRTSGALNHRTAM